MYKNILKRIILILTCISVIILSCILTYILFKYPFKNFTHLEWLGDPTISDYGQLIHTKFLFNNSFIIGGFIITLNSILIAKLLKTENKYLTYLFLLASIGMLGVGIIPIPITNKPILSILHWTFGFLTIILYPIVTSFLIKTKNKKLGNFLFYLTIFLLIISLLTYLLYDYQKLYGEIILGIDTLVITIVLNLLYIKELGKITTEKKSPSPVVKK